MDTNQKPVEVKILCTMIGPSGRLYNKGEYKIEDLNEEDVDFILSKQSRVTKWVDIPVKSGVSTTKISTEV